MGAPRLFVALALALALATPLRAQDDTLAQLRGEIGALSALVAELAGQLSSGVAVPQAGLDGSVLDQVERLRVELAALTGRTEALEFRIRRVIDDASNRIGDMEFRLTELEGGDPSALPPARPLGGDATGGTTASAPAPELAAGEQAAFDAARAALDGGDMAGGIAALESFLQTYPGSPLGTDASTALARAHTANGAEAEAARTWLNLYLAAPDGDSAPGALYELGESLGRLAQVSEACIMFDELLTRFPAAPQVASAQAAKARLSCP